jgi:hypothetical protein
MNAESNQGATNGPESEVNSGKSLIRGYNITHEIDGFTLKNLAICRYLRPLKENYTFIYIRPKSQEK